MPTRALFESFLRQCRGIECHQNFRAILSSRCETSRWRRAFSRFAATASAGGVLSQFAGDWSGESTVTTTAGPERIRCKVHYDVAPDAPPSSDPQLRKRQLQDGRKKQGLRGGHAATGKWNEITRDTIGNLSGTIANSEIKATMEDRIHGGPGHIDAGQPPVDYDQPDRSHRHFAGRDHVEANLAKFLSFRFCDLASLGECGLCGHAPIGLCVCAAVNGQVSAGDIRGLRTCYESDQARQHRPRCRSD